MAKGKPNIQNFIPESIRKFAEGEEVKTKTARDNTTPTRPEQLDLPAMPLTAGGTGAPKRQTAVRLTDQTMARVRRLAGMRAMQESRRVTTQEIMETAILEYVERELGPTSTASAPPSIAP
jgi:hypothetical protein